MAAVTVIATEGTSMGTWRARVTDADSTPNELLAGAGYLHQVNIDNTKASAVDVAVQLFDDLAASVSPGVDPPPIGVIVPAGETIELQFRDLANHNGLPLTTGCTLVVTTVMGGNINPGVKPDVEVLGG